MRRTLTLVAAAAIVLAGAAMRPAAQAPQADDALIKKARAIRQGARDFVESEQKVLEAGRADARRAAVAASTKPA